MDRQWQTACGQLAFGIGQNPRRDFEADEIRKPRGFSDYGGRIMEIPQRLIKYLNDKKIVYEILHHPEAFTAQTIAAAEHIKGRHHAKVVMVKAENEHLMMVLPANSRVDLEKLEKVVGKSVAVESEPEFETLFPDCAPGAMPPFGNLYGLPTYVDRPLSKEDFIGPRYRIA
jgi:Ala-tRNA(Pro) deacylase